MKKYLAIFSVLFTVILSSCSNDDIPVSSRSTITFKVNPATVVDNLYELSAGDLTSLSAGSVLNVCLYIYDESGHLVDQDVQTFNAYTNMMTSSIDLEDGVYTAVAISYVSSSVEYWGFSGMDDLNTLKITDNGYIGGKSKILGMTIKEIGAAGDRTCDIDIHNAGAVAAVAIINWNRYSDVESYGLAGKQSCDYITLKPLYGSYDGDDCIEYSIKSKSEYGFYKVKYDYNPNITRASSYFFTFPMKNAAMKFFAETTDGSIHYLGANMVDDIKRGDSYLIGYDVTSEETKWYNMTPSRSSSNADSPLVEFVKSDKPQAVYDYETGTITIR